MAITSNQSPMWNPLTKPVIGSVCMDNSTMQVKVFDGSVWITLSDNIALDEMKLSDIQNMMRDRNNMSDGWLETKYTDLKDLRERAEKEYNTLRDKYKVFEILNLNAERHEN